MLIKGKANTRSEIKFSKWSHKNCYPFQRLDDSATAQNISGSCRLFIAVLIFGRNQMSTRCQIWRITQIIKKERIIRALSWRRNNYSVNIHIASSASLNAVYLCLMNSKWIVWSKKQISMGPICDRDVCAFLGLGGCLIFHCTLWRFVSGSISSNTSVKNI